MTGRNTLRQAQQYSAWVTGMPMKIPSAGDASHRPSRLPKKRHTKQAPCLHTHRAAHRPDAPLQPAQVAPAFDFNIISSAVPSYVPRATVPLVPKRQSSTTGRSSSHVPCFPTLLCTCIEELHKSPFLHYGRLRQQPHANLTSYAVFLVEDPEGRRVLWAWAWVCVCVDTQAVLKIL